MDGMDEVLTVPLEKAAQYVGMIFLQGLDLIGATARRESAEWFVRAAWEKVVASVNDVQDGEYRAAELGERLRAEYLLAANIAEPPEVLPGESIVWEAVARALAMLVEVGELTPDQTSEEWGSWIALKLEREGFRK